MRTKINLTWLMADGRTRGQEVWINDAGSKAASLSRGLSFALQDFATVDGAMFGENPVGVTVRLEAGVRPKAVKVRVKADGKVYHTEVTAQEGFPEFTGLMFSALDKLGLSAGFVERVEEGDAARH